MAVGSPEVTVGNTGMVAEAARWGVRRCWR